MGITETFKLIFWAKEPNELDIVPTQLIVKLFEASVNFKSENVSPVEIIAQLDPPDG